MALGFKNLRERFMKLKFLMPAIIIAGIFILTGWLLLKPSQQKPQGYVTHLDSHGISLSSDYRFAPNGDKDKNKKINGGDTVTFSIVVTNKSKQAARSVTVNTGIRMNSIAYLHNYRGITGISYKDPEVTLRNIVVLPGETQTLSFDALMLLSGSDRTISIVPALVDAGGSEVVKGESKKIIVAKVDMSRSTTTTVTATQQGGQ